MTARTHKLNCKCKKYNPMAHFFKARESSPLISGYGSTKVNGGTKSNKFKNAKEHDTEGRDKHSRRF